MKGGEGGGGAYNRTKKSGISLRFWETAHLPLPLVKINTYFSLRAKCWHRWVGSFPET